MIAVCADVPTPTPSSVPIANAEATTRSTRRGGTIEVPRKEGTISPPPSVVQYRARLRQTGAGSLPDHKISAKRTRPVVHTSRKKKKKVKACKESSSDEADDDEDEHYTNDHEDGPRTMIVGGVTVKVNQTTIGESKWNEVMDGDMPEMQQRKWLETYRSVFIERYDTANVADKLYGRGEYLQRYFARLATKDGVGRSGFIMIKGLARNCGKEQTTMMADIVAVHGATKEVIDYTGSSSELSRIRYRSDKVCAGGTDYVMSNAEEFVRNGCTRVQTSTHKVDGDLRQAVSIVIIDPDIENMKRLQRLYLEINRVPLQLGQIDGATQLGNLQPYVDRGVRIHYITQGTLHASVAQHG